MTNEEARRHFGLKDSDPISEEGVLSLIRSNQEQLKVWSISSDDRKECEYEIEALRTLLLNK